MNSFAALLRSSARLQAASSRSNTFKLQLALQRWQLCSDKAFSAKADDQDSDGESISHFVLLCFTGSFVILRVSASDRGRSTGLTEELLA